MKLIGKGSGSTYSLKFDSLWYADGNITSQQFSAVYQMAVVITPFRTVTLAVISNTS